MAATLADQLLIARKTIEEGHRKQEEEYRKNIEALERVARFLPADQEPLKSNGSLPKAATQKLTTRQEVKDEDVETEDQFGDTDGDGQYVIRAVLAAVNARPDVTFYPRLVYQTLLAGGFPFTTDERRSLVTIGTSMKKLARRNPPLIRLIRHGKGRKPNLYRAVDSEARTASPGVQVEVTM